MSKYQATIHFPNGEMELLDLFDTEEEAREAVMTAIVFRDIESTIQQDSSPIDFKYDENDDTFVGYVDYDIDEIVS